MEFSAGGFFVFNTYLYCVKQLLDYIGQQLNITILNYQPLSGGDISNVYLLETLNQRLVLKENTNSNALALIHAEQLGLSTIAATKTIQTPDIFLCDTFQDGTFLLMEYIESKRPDKADFERLGQAVGHLHRVSTTSFGFPQNNFIGSLTQSNTNHTSWLHFYVSQRLLPQFQLALEQNLLSKEEIPSKAILLENGTSLFENIQPSLLHGDLWSGNFLIATDGTPYLIDPAVYYGHSEVDIAMTRLFGGFGATFYDAYQEIHPSNNGASIRQNWYQLYYLLVHLNMFGRGYYGQVKRVFESL